MNNWNLTATTPPPANVPVIAYNEKWVDEHINPKGMRGCSVDQLGIWTSFIYDYDNEVHVDFDVEIPPTHWQHYPDVPPITGKAYKGEEWPY